MLLISALSYMSKSMSSSAEQMLYSPRLSCGISATLTEKTSVAGRSYGNCLAANLNALRVAEKGEFPNGAIGSTLVEGPTYPLLCDEYCMCR